MGAANPRSVTKCLNWVELLQQRADVQNEITAFTFVGDGTAEQNLSFLELDRGAREVAVGLLNQVNAGDRVLLCHPSGFGFIKALFGCFYAGVIAVPAFPPRSGRRSMDRLNAIAEDAGAQYALIDSDILSRIQPQLERNETFRRIKYLTTDTMNIGESTSDFNLPEVESDTIALIQYTSGSTSRPRGVMLSHGSLLHNCELIGHAFELLEGQVYVGWLPMYHDMGLVGNVMASIYHGVRSVLMPPEAFLMKPERWLRALSKYGGRISGGPNFAYELCVQRISEESKQNLDLSTWEVAFCGAEPVRPDTLSRFTEAFSGCGYKDTASYPCYGLAEATLLVTGGSADRKPNIKSFSAAALRENQVVEDVESDTTRCLVGCGHVWSDQEVLVVDPESRERCTQGRVGEICVRGGSVASGYWNQPQETAEIFGFTLIDSDKVSYLRTGDLGFIHEGELFVIGRSKSMMIVNGQNHFAEDIEISVEQAHPAICLQGVAAFSIEESNTEKVLVVVEVDRRFGREAGQSEKGVEEALKKLVVNIRIMVAERHTLSLKEVHLVRQMSIPKTSSGKVMRNATRKAFLDGTLNSLLEINTKGGGNAG